ncbi:MAG: MaoC family dehydratase [Deltaproteobacteria bacterium]|jgi:acyl dehydratase|nr:MaoC family dehydratase [Deltaproteobacteria bacterium]
MSETSFSVPREDRCLEDYITGTVFEFAETVEASEADIVNFALNYDPQYFHTDPAQAAAGPYKGLIASGAQTIAMTFRLYVKNFLPGKASFGSPGLDELRWLRPVRPGDTLRLRLTILAVTPSQSKNDRGTVSSMLETINQHNETVMSCRCKNIIARRTSG